MSDLQKMGDDALRGISKAASENPLSAALIGAGILWMMSGPTRPVLGALSRLSSGVGSAIAPPLESVKDVITGSANAATSAVASATGKAKSLAADGSVSMSEMLTATRDQTSAYAGNLSKAVSEMNGTVRENLTELFHRQPLALAAVGLAIGAGIAASIPATDVEKDYLGQTSADVTSLISEQATNIKDAVLAEAKEQGLTADKAQEAIEVGLQKAKSVIRPADQTHPRT